jgi:agmatine deiminase
VLEGGSIQVDGEGTCLTTLECLGHPNRNPALSVAQLEAYLCAYLGVERVVWLPRGIPFDETGGHVDNLATFVAPGRVLLTWTEDRADPLAEVALETRHLLESSRDARGRAFEVVPVPAPRLEPVQGAEADGLMAVSGTKARRAGDPVAASYVNCYIANTVVVFPRIDDRHDDEVADLLAALFPGRRPVGVPARELLLGGGGIHCLTQQLPAVGHGATTDSPPG